MKISAGVETLVDHPQLFHAGQQPIQAQRGTDARQLLVRVELGQVVVAAAGADAAELRQLGPETSRRSCRCNSPGRGRSTHRARVARPSTPRPPCAAAATPASRCDAGLPGFAAGHQGRRARASISSLRPDELGQSATTSLRLARSLAPAVATISAATFSRPILASLSMRAARRTACSVKPARSSRPLSTCRLLTWILKSFEPDGPQQVVDHQHGFDVGGHAAGADRVEVALHELAIAAVLRVLAAPDGGDVIALERRAQLVRMLRRETAPAARSDRTACRPTARRDPGTGRAACRSRRPPCRSGFRGTPAPACRSG